MGFKSQLGRLCLIAFFLILSTPPSLFAAEFQRDRQEAKNRLSARELMASDAAQLFANRRFEEALTAFKKLAGEYPQDAAMRRYIGACLDNLNRDEEAIAAFLEAIALDPADFLSRQFLAKIYLRMGLLNQAEEQFRYLAENDKSGTFAQRAKTQLESGQKITPQEFLKTRAAQAFMNAKYEEALEELSMLESRYPQDILLKRYQGLALDRLAQYDKAVSTYREGLKIAPHNIPLHYYLAQALLHKRDLNEAAREFKYVIQRDESNTYRVRAQQGYASITKWSELAQRRTPKKWTLSASTGVEWNSNPASNTRVKAFKTLPTRPAWRLSDYVGGTYDFFRKGPVLFRANYAHADSFYTNKQSKLNTLLNIGGVNAIYVGNFLEKPLILQAGHTAIHTMVRGEYYSASFVPSMAVVYPIKDWYRITGMERWAFTTYNSDGSAPDSTARDGFSNLAGITNNFYFNKAKTFSALLGFDYGRDDTQGINYRKDAFSSRTGLHFPLPFKFEGDVNFKFRDSQYPKYGYPSDTPGRRDLEYTFGTSLSRPLGRNWVLSANYQYTDNNSRDDNFTYINQAVGINISYNL